MTETRISREELKLNRPSFEQLISCGAIVSVYDPKHRVWNNVSVDNPKLKKLHDTNVRVR